MFNLGDTYNFQVFLKRLKESENGDSDKQGGLSIGEEEFSTVCKNGQCKGDAIFPSSLRDIQPNTCVKIFASDFGGISLLTGVVRFNNQVINFLTTVICNPVHTCMNVELEVVVIRRSTAGYIQYSIITLERYTFSLFIRWLNW